MAEENDGIEWSVLPELDETNSIDELVDGLDDAIERVRRTSVQLTREAAEARRINRLVSSRYAADLRDAEEAGYQRARDKFRENNREWLGDSPSASASTEDQEGAAQVLMLNVGFVGLKTRTVNKLKNAGITTLGELVRWSEAQLREIRFFSDKSVEDVINMLDQHGLALRVPVVFDQLVGWNDSEEQ